MKNLFNNGTQQINIGIQQHSANAALSQTANGNEPAGKIATSGLDAMDVEFEVRSSKPLHNPYVVTMTRFHTVGSKPGFVQNMVYAKSLNPIDEHLSHVHFVEEGFPYDYELIDFQLHIYDRGEEIATNIAADRVELTRDEAFEYVRSEYIGAHPEGHAITGSRDGQASGRPSRQARPGKIWHVILRESVQGWARRWGVCRSRLYPKDQRRLSRFGRSKGTIQAGVKRRQAG